MIQLPQHPVGQYREYNIMRGIQPADFPDHLKWLRYFLDFCEKYKVGGEEKQRLDHFMDKLVEKKQSEIYTHCVPFRTMKEPEARWISLTE